MTSLHQTNFPEFAEADFDAMLTPGLEGRMEAIISQVRPKLQLLGDNLSPFLTELTGEPMHTHVAKHARRSVNPPDDTWVAWSRNARGYKAHPHFQVGLWPTHLFIQFAIIYESPNKTVFAQRAEDEMGSLLAEIPDSYVWSKDHTLPGGTPHAELKGDALLPWLTRLKTVKAAEITCGLHVPKGDPVLADGEALLRLSEATFRKLLPLYKLSF